MVTAVPALVPTRIAAFAAFQIGMSARLSQIAGYAPSEGDRVVVARDGEELYVVAVLQAARPPALAPSPSR